MLTRDLILLTGATGYVGGRLLRALEQSGRNVRCLVHGVERLTGRVAERTQLAEGDGLDGASLRAALAGVGTAYYLIDLAAADRFSAARNRAAENFARVAKQSGVLRIVYLSQLDPDPDQEQIGRILRGSGADVLEFRSSPVLGSGSLLFEMIRAKAGGLFVAAPRWLRTPITPIAIADVLDYLLLALELPPARGSRVFEIGGQACTAADLMREYARQRGRRLRIVPVPGDARRAAGLWLGLTTPLHPRAAHRLIDGLASGGLARDREAQQIFGVKPTRIPDAIAAAIDNDGLPAPQTRWCDAISSGRPTARWNREAPAGRLTARQELTTAAPPGEAFDLVRRIGGQTGWYYGNWLWRLRGFLDVLLGGVGMKRGRRAAAQLHVGDTLDCWRVQATHPGRLLLFAEMRTAGQAWLDLVVQPVAGGGSRLTLLATFEPRCLRGRLYWQLLRPIHAVLFSGLLGAIARRVEAATGQPAAEPISGGLSAIFSELRTERFAGSENHTVLTDAEPIKT